MASVILVDTDSPTFDLQGTGVLREHYQPSEVTVDALKEAQLILIDFKIDDWKLLTDEGLPELAKPPDGLAVAHSVRRHLCKAQDHSPPAVALITNQYQLAAHPLAETILPYSLARLNGIEWVFKKSDPASAIADLAQACSPELYDILKTENPEERITRLCVYLGVADEESQGYISDEIETCDPPLHQYLKWDDGLLILRWLLHRILPYPTFLVADTYLAERGQCNLAQLQALLNAQPEVLQSSHYKGPGSALFGRRFWRSTFERWLVAEMQGNTTDPSAVRAFIGSKLGEDLEPATSYQVECVDPDGRYGSLMGARAEVTKAVLDDWPTFADSPWKLP